MSNRARCGARPYPTAAAGIGVTTESSGRPLRWRLTMLWAAAAIALTPALAAAQTAFYPYYNKNQIRYDRFQWHIYDTEHFEIFYYPEIEPHLERIAGYAESAYQQISSTLRQDLPERVPLILFQTSSEFQQQNVVPGAAQEGVGAFAEPMRQRIVMPIDDPPDLLYRLIVHELTHQFEFSIMPSSLVGRPPPLWVMEGLADYMTGLWQPLDLAMVRDAAIADIVPRMSRLEAGVDTGSPRLVYNLGHAVFEFIVDTWGEDGLRQFLFSLRRSVIGVGADDAYMDAFQLEPDDFDREFDRYLKERFKPFRDKERPADYGRSLGPNPETTPFRQAYSVEPSPSGDLLAVTTVNARDQELDIVLISAHDGRVFQNLTPGFDQGLGFEYLTVPGGRFNTVPWVSWSPTNDVIAYFVRKGKSRTLILQSPRGPIERRIDLQMVDNPESPSFSPDGRKIAFAALQGAVGDIFVIDLETEEVTNITNDSFADSGPTWAPDGRSIVYLARVSRNEKLFRVDLDTGQKTQLTFGAHDETAARFLDDDTLVFSSTALDPTVPVDPLVASNGEIFNIWTLNLQNGELRQYTDAIGGNVSPVVLREGNATPRILFTSYYKGEFSLQAIGRRDPMVIAATEDFGSPGDPRIEFQSPLSHTLIAANARKKGRFEKMFLDGRPPVNVGVTSGGDIFGGSAVTFSDVLGDQQFNIYAASVSQYRTTSFSYINLSRRLNYAIQAFSQTQFFYGNLSGALYDPTIAPFITRDMAQATRTTRGVTLFGIYPLDLYRRLELTAGFVHFRERYNDPDLGFEAEQYQLDQFGRPLFRNGTSIPLGISYIQETTVFREFGPLSGNTMRFTYEYAPGELARQTVDIDARLYKRLGASGLLALRAAAFKSWGQAPSFTYFGGNSEMRGYEYLEFIGDNSLFLNAELRFPLIEAMLTPIGILGGIRGVLFANMGGAHFDGQPFKWASNRTEVRRPILGYRYADPFTSSELIPVEGDPMLIRGFRLVDSRASYGIGLETFALGFPIHFDYAWRTLFNKSWEDFLFFDQGGSSRFRRPKFSVWIGYDF